MKKSWWLVFLLVLPYTLAKPAEEVLKDVWGGVITAGSLKWLNLPGDVVLVAFVRILIFILIFAIFFAVFTGLGDRVFSFLSRRHAAIVALVLAIISSIFMPAAIILAIGGGLGTLVSLLLIGLPILALGLLLLSLPHDKCYWNFIKFIITGILYWIIAAVKYHITNVLNVNISPEIISSVAVFTDWAIGITIVLLIYYILKMLGCLFGKAGRAVEISFSDILDRIRQRASRPDSDDSNANPPSPPPPGDPQKGTLQGLIIDPVSQQPIESTITITNGGRDVNKFTGKYDFPKLKPGVYSIVSKPINDAYNTITKGNVTLAAGQTLREDFRHTLNHEGDATELSGKIYDLGNNNHLLRSYITITQESQVLVNNLFAGVYKFERFTPGTYNITSTPDDRSYPPISKVLVIREGQNEHDFAHKSAASDARIKGTIKGNNREIISQITLSQGNNVIMTRSRKGEYHFPDLAPGSYIIESKPGRGFNTITQEVTILPSDETKVNFEHTKQVTPPSDGEGDGSKDGSGKKNYKFFTGIVANIKAVIKNINEFNLNEAKKVWADCKRSTTRARKVCEKLFKDLEKDHPGHRALMVAVLQEVDLVRKEMNKIKFTADLNKNKELEVPILEIANKLSVIEINIHKIIHKTLRDTN